MQASNPRPSVYKTAALPSELIQPNVRVPGVVRAGQAYKTRLVTGPPRIMVPRRGVEPRKPPLSEATGDPHRANEKSPTLWAELSF